MAKLTLSDVTAGYLSATTYNANNAALVAALENTLSRDGTSPNTMAANLDMNSYRIQNLPTAVANSEPITLAQASSIASVSTAFTKENVGAVLWAQTSAETTAGVTPTNYYYEPGDVRRYGATGDGSTDDTTAINNAITVVNTAGGGEVIFPGGGTYVCLSVVMKSNVVLNLNGSTLLKNAGAAGTHVVDFTGATTATSTTLSSNAAKTDGSLTVTDESGFSAGDIILIYDATYKYSTFGRNQEINRVISTAANTINLACETIGSYATASTATVVKLSAIENAGIMNGTLKINSGDNGGCIYMKLSYDCFINECVVIGFNDEAGIQLEQTFDVTVSNNTVRDGQNLTSGGYGYGVQLNESCARIVVIGNRFENVRENIFTNNVRHCVFSHNACRSSESNGINTHASGNEHVVIANNSFVGSRQYAIAVAGGTNAPDKYISIIGNTIEGPDASAIVVSNNSDGTKDNAHILIANNIIRDYGVSSASSGGIFIYYSNDVTIVGNRIDGGNQAESDIGIQTLDADRVTIKDNVIQNIAAGFGITINSNTTDTVIDGNRFWDISSWNIRETGSGQSGIVVINNTSDDDLVTFSSSPRRHSNFWGSDYDTNYGAAATVADGGTITHNMQGTPSIVTATGSVASEMVSVTAIGATTFTVAIKKDDGTAGTTQTIYWQANM